MRKKIIRVRVRLRDDVARKFRRMAMLKYGEKKGFLSKFAVDIVEYMSERETAARRTKEPSSR